MFTRQIVPAAATVAVALLAACGGGGSTSAPLTPAVPAPTSAPTSSPTAPPTTAPTTAPAAAPLTTASLAGSPGFINKQSHTVYVFDADLAAAGTSTCNGGCATVWPAISVPATASVPAPFGIIKRSDGSSQLTYAGRPLYTYIADSAPGSIAGNGITSFGATWHIARPAGTAPVPGPTSPGSIY